MIGHLAGVTDAAEEDRIECGERFERVLRHHFADLEVAITAPVEGLERDIEPILGSGGRRGCRRFGRNLRANPVTGYHCYAVRNHVLASRPLRSGNPTGSGSNVRVLLIR